MASDDPAGGGPITAPGESVSPAVPRSRADLVLPHDLYKVYAVSRLASELGLMIDNPWQSSTVAKDIGRISEALGILCNQDVRFASHREVPSAEQMHVFSTPPRPFPAPAFANIRHDIFARLPTEDHFVSSPDFNILSVRDGYFCHFMEAPVVVAADGETIISDYSSNYAGLVHFHPHALHDCIADAKYIDGVVVPIADDVQSANISHWILDWLPRLAFLGPRARDPNVFVVTSQITTDFQRETLRLCGIPADRVIALNNFAAIRARELLVPSNLGSIIHPAFTAAPWALTYLQSTLGLGALREAGPAAADGDRIYISRRDSQWRRVLNEPELVDRLAGAGYREAVLSTLPIVQQIATLARAKRVVGLHGAGLTHIIFTPPEARLLEILPISYATPAFYALVAGLGNRYLSYVADQVTSGPASSFDDVTLDVDDFETTCRAFYADP